MKPVVLTEEQWNRVFAMIKKDHPPSIWLIRENMKRVLGFTPRTHEEWLGYYDTASDEARRSKRCGYHTSVHLDFYNEHQRTMFLLKYGDKIGC